MEAVKQVEVVLCRILYRLTLYSIQTCSRTGLEVFRLGVKSPTGPTWKSSRSLTCKTLHASTLASPAQEGWMMHTPVKPTTCQRVLEGPGGGGVAPSAIAAVGMQLQEQQQVAGSVFTARNNNLFKTWAARPLTACMHNRAKDATVSISLGSQSVLHLQQLDSSKWQQAPSRVGLTNLFNLRTTT